MMIHDQPFFYYLVAIIMYYYIMVAINRHFFKSSFH